QDGTGSIVSFANTADAASDAVKLTNLGSGNSFLVEDESSDTSPFVIDADGKVGIGTTTPSEKLTLAGPGNFLQTSGNPVVEGGVTDSTYMNGAISVYVSGKYAYVAGYNSNSLAIIDISNPSSPSVVGGVIDSTYMASASSVYVSGKYAYVAGEMSNSLAIIDISNPSSPSVVGGVIDSTYMASASSVYVSGKYAYVAGWDSDSLAVVDISNPSSPSVVGGVTNSTYMNGAISVYVSGKYAYVAGGSSNSLAVVDISNPSSPSVVGGVIDSTYMNNASSVYVSGKYAYVAGYNSNSLAVVDISNPSSPSVVGGVIDSTYMNGPSSVYVSGKYAYVAGGSSNSLAIIDISNPSSPSVVGGVTDLAYMVLSYSVYVSGKYAYVAGWWFNSLAVVDISGIDVPSGHIGDLAAGTIDVWENLNVANNIYGKGLNIGPGGIYSQGKVSIFETSSVSALTVTQNGTGDIVNLYDGSNSVLTLADGGRLTLAGLGATGATTGMQEIKPYEQDLDAVWRFNGTDYDDNTAEAGTSGGTQFEFLADTSDYYYFGHASKFDGMEFDLQTDGDYGALTWEYWNGSTSTWTSFTPTATYALASDGYITWGTLSSWATKAFSDTDPHSATPPDTTARYWVRVSAASVTTAAQVYQIALTGMGRALAVYPSNISSTPAFYIDRNGNLQVSSNSSASSLTVNQSGTGKLLNIQKGGTSVFEVDQANIIISQPLELDVAGDVGIDYDLYFANNSLSNITSAGALTISAGDANHYENLTLTTGNTGDVIIDIADSLLGFKVAGTQGGYVFRVMPSGDLDINSIASNFNTPFGGFGRYQNLLTYSEEFDNAAWTKTDLTATANSVAAPDGQTTADTLTSTASGGDIEQDYNTGGDVTGKSYIFSVWLRAASATTSRLKIISSDDGSADGTTLVSETRSVTSEWQRFYVKGTFGTVTDDFVKAQIVPVDGGTGTVYAWGAQLEEASDMGVYAYTGSAVVSATGRGMLAKDAELSGGLTIDGTITLGGGTAISKHLSATATLDFPELNDGTGNPNCSNLTITVTGAVVGDSVTATPTAVAGGIETLTATWNAYVSAADTVTIRACGIAADQDPASQTWRVDVWRH
ncbi:MAG: hypothetical protein DRO40_09735, partial [Thermoprotei archaeon]